jgi:hypothetical protein
VKKGREERRRIERERRARCRDEGSTSSKRVATFRKFRKYFPSTPPKVLSTPENHSL